jgi:hypothetical protein
VSKTDSSLPIFVECYGQYHLGNQIKKTEIGRACSTYGERRGAHRVLGGKPEGRRPLGRAGMDGRIILKWIFQRWNGVD